MLLLARDKTRIIRFAPVAFVLAFCHAVAGQPDTPEDRLARLMDSVENCKVSLSFGRRGPYIPGERATVTIKLTNATSNALEIPDPNDARSGGLDLCTKGGPLAAPITPSGLVRSIQSADRHSMCRAS